MKNHPARNTYYFLPLLLGLIGLFFHLDKNVRDFWVVMSGSKVLLPRMYSRDPNHKQAYREFGTISDADNPSYLDNLEFLFRYQIGHMYLRYFMWNFAGRQNDIQGHGNVLNGNWISGIKAIDSARIGPQKILPENMKNHPARNTYYFLPLLLGLIGLFFQTKMYAISGWS
jgi:hypothetical protein